MKLGIVPVALIGLSITPCTLVAQHGTRGAGSGASTGSAGSRGAPTDDPDLADFKHAMQVQANPYQVAEFQTVSKNTAEALRRAHDFAQLAASAKNSADILSDATDLDDAVEEAQKSNTHFVKILSDSQTAGLKKLLKNLSKAGSPVGKQQKILSRETEQPTGDAKRLAVEADRLEKALTGFQTSQLNLAKEMGIQNH